MSEKYWAELGFDKTVLRVVVCDTKEWLEQNLGGTWVETKIGHATEQYAGHGMHDSEVIAKERFIPSWQQPVAEGYPKGAKVWHLGHGWLSLVDANFWEPSVGNQWRDYTEEWPKWTSIGRNYLKDERVSHNGLHYRSLKDGNASEPGKSPLNWALITEREVPLL